MNSTIQIAVIALAGVALAGGGYVAGMTAAQGQATPAGAQATTPEGRAAALRGASGQGEGPGARGAVLPDRGQVVGKIISVNEGSVTVEVTQQGGTVAPTTIIALVGPTTRLVKTVETEIKLTDLRAGDQVVIVGQRDQATGTIAANAVVAGLSSIQQLFGGFIQGGGAPGQRPGGRQPVPSPTGR